jgi:hypothetical protein
MKDIAACLTDEEARVFMGFTELLSVYCEELQVALARKDDAIGIKDVEHAAEIARKDAALAAAVAEIADLKRIRDRLDHS